MSSNQKTLVFAVVLCVICSFFLSLAATGLKPLQQKNELIDRQKNILKALDILEAGKKYKPKEIEALYPKSVANRKITKEGKLVEYKDKSGKYPIYIVYQGERVKKYAIPISGYGLWSTLYGYLALDGDGKTVIGFTIYQHGETPGLGAEAEKPWFGNQFKGKKIIDKAGEFVSVGVVKGKAADSVSPDKLENYVDGISGATITARGINSFLKKDLDRYEPFARRLRRGSL